ncbi:hypothetical protein K488DRAFT_89395, partial [Vararia minispora EC-137]
LSRVPAGATDWDVPYPFRAGEGPAHYAAHWPRARIARLLSQLLALVQAATRSAPARSYLARVGAAGRKRAEADADARRTASPTTTDAELDNLMALFAGADAADAPLFADFPLPPASAPDLAPPIDWTLFGLPPLQNSTIPPLDPALIDPALLALSGPPAPSVPHSSATSTPSTALSPSASYASLGPLTPSDAPSTDEADKNKRARRPDVSRYPQGASHMPTRARAAVHARRVRFAVDVPPPEGTPVWEGHPYSFGAREGYPYSFGATVERSYAHTAPPPPQEARRAPLSALEILAAQSRAVERARAASTARFLERERGAGEKGGSGGVAVVEAEGEVVKGKGTVVKGKGTVRERESADTTARVHRPDKAALLARARARREVLACELERTRTELWEAVIEGGALGFVGKDVEGR